MERGNPLVSIIVRTKDRPVLLKRALQSITDQTYRPIEVVLVNDGGCDLNVDELKAILGDITLNYIRLEKNTGRANAGNVGIGNAKGEYIGFLDDDDEYYSYHITILVNFLEKSDYKVAYTDSIMVYREWDSNASESMNNSERKAVEFSQDFNFDRLIFENYIPFMCLLFKRETLLNSGGFDINFELYEDWDLLIRIGNKYTFHHIQQITAKYHQWDVDFQISQKNRDPKFLRQTYLQLLSKHIDKITPSRIHDYMIDFVNTRNLLKETREKLDIYKKDPKIGELYTQLTEKEAQIRAFEVELTEKNTQINILNVELKEKDIEINALKSEMKKKYDQIVTLQTENSEKDDLITAMKNTRGWRLLERYRRLRNRIMAVRRSDRIKESLIIKGIKVVKNQGFKAALRKANKKLLFNKSVKKTLSTVEISPLLSCVIEKDITESPIKSRVSVVIPTKNAGEEFDYILRRITQQEGIGEIELIIVDSGSEDKTIDIAREYTKNIFQIPSGDFHHARTRNYGSGKAAGEFLVFTVQDAIPVSNHWLYKLLYPIQQGQASAVSTRQIPRSDADLFSSWSYWSHNIKYLGGDHDCICNNTLFKDFGALDIQSKRSMARLDNVSLGIKKSVFDAYEFLPDYAEDLDLGIRLIKDGHALLFQSSNAVIHSHNRPAFYFFKRSYADTVALWDILRIERGDLPAGSVMEALNYVYSAFKMSIFSSRRENWSTQRPSDAVNDLIRRISHNIKRGDPILHLLEGDRQVDEFFRNIRPFNHKKMANEMNRELQNVLESFSDFTEKYVAVCDIEQDFLNSMYKLFCITAGHYLAVNSMEYVRALKGSV